MPERLHRFVFSLLLVSFILSLMKTTSFTMAESNEEEVELGMEKIGDKEIDEEIDFLFNEVVSHEIENIHFDNQNASKINRIASRNYCEPQLDTPYSPPEKNS